MFPATNLTDSYGQVNGVSSLDYLDFFVSISSALGRNSIIVNSPIHNNDEMIAGRNIITRIFNGNVVKREILIPGLENTAYQSFIRESEDLDEHILKFIGIIEGKCPKDIILTIAYNTACILNLEYQDILLDKLAEFLFQYIVPEDS